MTHSPNNSGASLPTKIAWTPDGSVRGLGSILLKPPEISLTREQYRFALADRIDLLVAKETPEVARDLLRILEIEERLVAPRNLRMVGELLVENSDRLAEIMGAFDFPIPLERIRHEPETSERLAEETLEDFLWALYPTETD